MDINNLTEKELKELNKLTQERLTAINEEKAKKKAIKDAYSLKDVPSTYETYYSSLGTKIKEYFKNPEHTVLGVELFNDLLEQCTFEVKPKREEIYSCPWCGDDNLALGHWGDNWQHKYAVYCRSCKFEIKKKESNQTDAWETFHMWLQKNGYLDKDVKFQW